jgi:2,3-bisphosphoglycerate-independent phosphoglycerate mutase
MGDAKKKIQAIEDVDRIVVATLLEGLKKRGEPYAVLVTPDHSTATHLRTHIPDPVPFALYTPGIKKDAVNAYTETAVKASSLRFEQGFELMKFFLAPR